MGLCDEERFQGLVWAVRHITNTAHDMKKKTRCPHEGQSRVLKLAKKLWPAFLGGYANGVHWLMGPKSLEDEVTPESLLQVALLATREKRDEEEDHKNIKDPVVRHMFQYGSDFLKGFGDSDLKYPAEMYLGIEQAFYYLNRYTDAFSKRYKKLADTMAQLWGALFQMLENQHELLAGFCLAKIYDKIIGYRHDLITELWTEENLQHHYCLDEAYNWKITTSPERLCEIWKMLQPMKHDAISTELRLQILLDIVGRHYHYTHQHEKLMGMIEKHNRRHKADIVHAEDIKEILKACVSKYEKSNERYKDPHKYCWLTENRWGGE
jgi:hypothetical protein